MEAAHPPKETQAALAGRRRLRRDPAYRPPGRLGAWRCRPTRRTRMRPGSSCSGSARPTSWRASRPLGGGASPMRLSSFKDPRVLAAAKVGPGTTRHFPAIEWTINNAMGSEPDMPAWAEISNNVIPVELGKLLAGQYSSPQECMDAIKAKADELAAPFRKAARGGGARAPPRPVRGLMDLVLGIDSSTTATKAIAWDRAGRAVAEGRASLPMRDLGRGWMEQSVDDWWRSLGAALRDLFRQVDPARVAALAISNQRETVGFLDEAGEEVRPAILWLDERCRPDIDLFGAKLPPERFRAITGKTPDPTPAVFSLHWLHALRARALAAHGALRRRAGLSRLAPDRPARRRAGAAPTRTACSTWPAHATARRSWRSSGLSRGPAVPGGAAGDGDRRGHAGCRRGHRPAARHAGRGRRRRRAGRRPWHRHARRRQGLSQHRHGRRVRRLGRATSPTSHALPDADQPLRRGLHLRALPAHRRLPGRLERAPPVRRRPGHRSRHLPAAGGRGRRRGRRCGRRAAAALLVGDHGAVLGPGRPRRGGRPAAPATAAATTGARCSRVPRWTAPWATAPSRRRPASRSASS